MHLLFSLVNYSRHIGIDSNESLKKSTNKFISRYKKLEEIIENKNYRNERIDYLISKFELDNIKNIKVSEIVQKKLNHLFLSLVANEYLYILQS